MAVLANSRASWTGLTFVGVACATMELAACFSAAMAARTSIDIQGFRDISLLH